MLQQDTQLPHPPPAPVPDLVWGPSFRLPLPDGKSIHLTLKANVPMARMEEVWRSRDPAARADTRASMFAAVARAFDEWFVQLEANGLPD